MRMRISIQKLQLMNLLAAINNQQIIFLPVLLFRMLFTVVLPDVSMIGNGYYQWSLRFRGCATNDYFHWKASEEQFSFGIISHFPCMWQFSRFLKIKKMARWTSESQQNEGSEIFSMSKHHHSPPNFCRLVCHLHFPLTFSILLHQLPQKEQNYSTFLDANETFDRIILTLYRNRRIVPVKWTLDRNQF